MKATKSTVLDFYVSEEVMHRISFDGNSVIALDHTPEDFERQVTLHGLGDRQICSCVTTVMTAIEMLKHLEVDTIGDAGKSELVRTVHNRHIFSLIQQVSSMTSYALLTFDYSGKDIYTADAPLCYFPMVSHGETPILNVGEFISCEVSDRLLDLTNLLLAEVVRPLQDKILADASGLKLCEREATDYREVNCDVYIVLPAARVFIRPVLTARGQASVDLKTKKLPKKLHKELLEVTAAINVKTVHASYSGSGDDGQVGSLADAEGNELVQMGVSPDLDDRVRSWIESYVLASYDWVNNEGGNGTVHMDLQTGDVTAEAFTNIEESKTVQGAIFDIRP